MGGQFFGTGSPGSPVSGSGSGRTYAYNALTTAPAVVAPANPLRISITFINPADGASGVTVYVAPQTVRTIANPNAATTLTPSTANLGGCVPIPPGGSFTYVGECQQQFQAFAASSTNPLTVLDSQIPG